MAKDHFETHYYQKDRVDWNFNVLFTGKTDVARMAQDYEPLLKHSGLYDPIKPEWLHSTILRVGLVDDFTEEEMLKVVDTLIPKLASLTLPEFVFDSWWLWSGNIVLHISPDDQYGAIYDAVIESMQEVVGDERTLKSPHGHFIPHVALAYSKSHHDELEINHELSAHVIQPAAFHATTLSLIRQWPVNGHYEWEVVRELSIGTPSNA